MPNPPLIGLPGRRKSAHQIDGFPDGLGSLDIDVYLADYGRGIIEAGGIPVNIPLDVDVSQLVGRLDGIVLTGGTDIDPSHYGAEAHPEVLGLEPERDDLELALYRGALDRCMPVLGICRGLQLMNVAHGGTLQQHVPSHARYDVDCDAPIHHVNISEDSVLGSLYGASLGVNSLHHQAIDRLGDGLTVTARAEDGTVEGVELDEVTIAVQWHPEMLTGRATDPIFSWLVDKASR